MQFRATPRGLPAHSGADPAVVRPRLFNSCLLAAYATGPAMGMDRFVERGLGVAAMPRRGRGGRELVEGELGLVVGRDVGAIPDCWGPVSARPLPVRTTRAGRLCVNQTINGGSGGCRRAVKTSTASPRGDDASMAGGRREFPRAEAPWILTARRGRGFTLSSSWPYLQFCARDGEQ